MECEDFASSLAEKKPLVEGRTRSGQTDFSSNYRSFIFGKLPPPACPGLCYKRVVLIDSVVLLRDTESDPMSKSNQVVLNLLPRRNRTPQISSLDAGEKCGQLLPDESGRSFHKVQRSKPCLATRSWRSGELACLAHVGSFSPFWLFLFHISRQVVPTFRHSPRAGQYPQTQLAVPSFSYFWTTKLIFRFIACWPSSGFLFSRVQSWPICGPRLALCFGCCPAHNLLLRYRGRGAM